MRTTLNRVMLGLLGLLLLLVGLSVLVGGLNLEKHWNFTMPHWWPWSGPKDVLLSTHDRTRYRSDGWWWPVVIAVLAVLLLIGLWWLFAQARRRRVRQVRVDSGDGQGALLRGRAVEDVLRSEAEAYDGVAWSGARLVGKRGNPRRGWCSDWSRTPTRRRSWRGWTPRCWSGPAPQPGWKSCPPRPGCARCATGPAG